jgi:hypothetical protein
LCNQIFGAKNGSVAAKEGEEFEEAEEKEGDKRLITKQDKKTMPNLRIAMVSR